MMSAIGQAFAAVDQVLSVVIRPSGTMHQGSSALLRWLCELIVAFGVIGLSVS